MADTCGSVKNVSCTAGGGCSVTLETAKCTDNGGCVLSVCNVSANTTTITNTGLSDVTSKAITTGLCVQFYSAYDGTAAHWLIE